MAAPASGSVASRLAVDRHYFTTYLCLRRPPGPRSICAGRRIGKGEGGGGGAIDRGLVRGLTGAGCWIMNYGGGKVDATTARCSQSATGRGGGWGGGQSPRTSAPQRAIRLVMER